jgi:hypothetical protein
MTTDLAQHPHLCYIYFLDVLFFSISTFCTIHRHMPNRRDVELYLLVYLGLSCMPWKTFKFNVVAVRMKLLPFALQ